MGMTAEFVAIAPDKLEHLSDDGAALADAFFERLHSHDDGSVDLDKAWAGIHFLLTGTAWDGDPPAADVVLGGTPLGDDLGYGPIRVLDPNQVAEVAAFLQSMPVTELRKRFDPQLMDEMEVYPVGIWERDGEEGFEYLAHGYEKLRDFYRVASERREAVLLAMV